MCMPSNAISTLLENFLTLSSKLLVVSRLACATLSVVNLALGTSVYSSLPCYIASLAFSLAYV